MTRPDQPEVAHLPVASPPANHGRTTAAWATVTIVVLGSLISSVAVAASLAWLFWVGLGVVVVGLVVGKVLRMLGLGQPDAPREQGHGS